LASFSSLVKPLKPTDTNKPTTSKKGTSFYGMWISRGYKRYLNLHNPKTEQQTKGVIDKVGWLFCVGFN
jgi:hypothetical protein